MSGDPDGPDDAPAPVAPPLQPPLLARPVYIDPARPAQPLQDLRAGAAAACDACRTAPGAGLIGATLLGVTAAYFAPKVFDYLLTRVRGEGADQPDEYELEVEPDDDEGER